MSWPHILSFSRIIAGPAVSALILSRPGDAYLLAAALFALSSLTDLIDGKLARYSQRVSPLGIFLDTTADKVLVCLTLVAMAIAGLSAAWIPLVIIGREFLISGLRSFAASCNRIISAHIWGKGKAAVTMVAIVLVLFTASGWSGGVLASSAGHGTWNTLYTVSSWSLYLAAVLTVISGARYFVDAWPLFRGEAARDDPLEEPRRMAAGGDG